jgi:hypothetical protein
MAQSGPLLKRLLGRTFGDGVQGAIRRIHWVFFLPGYLLLNHWRETFGKIAIFDGTAPAG